MLPRALGLFALAVVLASVALTVHRSGVLQSWLAPPPSKPKPFVFDNGSVRDAAARAASEPTRLTTLSPPGALRKCVRGDSVTYSNLSCPPGFDERKVTTDRVTVLPSEKTKTTAEASPRTGKTQRSLHDALDLHPDDQLRQRLIDRAVAAEAN